MMAVYPHFSPPCPAGFLRGAAALGLASRLKAVKIELGAATCLHTAMAFRCLSEPQGVSLRCFGRARRLQTPQAYA